ncbi:triacylglycerol esterase/lipase EstA (alpha/beta hydrolase family) [Arcanobacterium pluranimalium]|uniref:lipase family alpha/beta hydrolase n=1 Tax=Arcanobacterium pluranimalium TaxID=108028 RepID=UPI0019575A32|nr:alpha/beta fold hydrolase [Arcanobacterium pluranimalium]MBM7825746.1 triacylglycerol esterase/lipase EstA (alpha/beta hydrolase family) [Arcanobacterium pluranimalium]
MKFHAKICAAVSALALSFTVGTAAYAAEPTPANPGGVEALTSPGGVPANGYGPDRHTFVGAQMISKQTPGLNPLGANDFTCKPTPGTNPVLLIPGTGNDAYTAWAFFSPRLKQAGYCVYTFNYNPSTNPQNDVASFMGDIKQSAAFMAGFIDRVLASTGSEKIDIIGHSQGGGALPRAYIKWYGGDKKVDKLIGLVPSNTGTTMMGMDALILQLLEWFPNIETKMLNEHNSQALLQQLIGSKFMTELNAGQMTYPDVKYTVISTVFDTMITPHTRSYLPAAPNVTNMNVQDVCPLDLHGHPNMPYDEVALQLSLNALNPAAAKPINCAWIPNYLTADDLK